MRKLAFPFTPVSAIKLAISTMLGVASIHYLRLGRREHDVSKLVYGPIRAFLSLLAFS